MTGGRRVGRSVQGSPIELVEFGQGERPRLMLAGVHGDEPKSVNVARRLCVYLAEVAGSGEGWRVLVVPVVNPDGYAVRRRRNARWVDLNRNLPTADWSPTPRRSRFYGGPKPASEPETRAIVGLIETVQPAEIVSIHSISDQRQCNNFDGPGEPLARAMAACNGYPVTGSIGYATPGSLGSWAGEQLQIPTVTLELPSHHSPRRCWEDNRAALLVGLGVQPV